MAAPQQFLLGPDSDGRSFATHDRHIGTLQDSARPLPLPCADSQLVPGRINAHTHIYSGLAPLGMPAPQPEPATFLQILQRVWWRLDRALDEASLRAAARYYAAESLLAGTTTLVDHHESPNLIEGSLDILAEACHELGIRALLAYGATERNGGRREARRGLAECSRFIRFNDRRLVRGLVALHASFTVSDDTIYEAASLCRELDTVMHVHVAEDGVDVDDAVARGERGPFERLLRLDALPPGSILAHCVHCSPVQVRAIAAEQLWIVQNPRSNRGNGVGYPRGLRESRRVALGTDGYPSAMDDEIAILRTMAPDHGEDPAVAQQRLTAGLQLAGERLGVRLAPLTVGCAADIVAMRQGRARHVVVDGKLVVRDGQLLTGDIEEIRAEAHMHATRLWKIMSSL